MANALALGLLLPFVFISGMSCEKEKNPHKKSPVIQSFTPESAAKDSIVIIEGANFSTILTENVVTINGFDATVLTATDTRITVKVPLHAGNGKIALRVGNKTTTSEKDFTYLFTGTTPCGVIFCIT